MVDKVLDAGCSSRVEGELADDGLVGAHVGTDMIDRAGGANRLIHGGAQAHITDDDVLGAQGSDLLGLLLAMDQGPDRMSLTVEGPDHCTACLPRGTGDENHGTLPS